MKSILPTLLVDGYKVGHYFQYPQDTEYVYSNFTPRKSRTGKDKGVVFFGLQYFIAEYLILWSEFRSRVNWWLGACNRAQCDVHGIGGL